MTLPEYDWIQWYVLIAILYGIVDAIGKHGQIARPTVFRLTDHFIGLLFALPFIGRVLKWW